MGRGLTTRKKKNPKASRKRDDQKSARNVAADALKLRTEASSDVRHLTSTASWASDVEDEHEAIDWTGLPRPCSKSKTAHESAKMSKKKEKVFTDDISPAEEPKDGGSQRVDFDSGQTSWQPIAEKADIIIPSGWDHHAAATKYTGESSQIWDDHSNSENQVLDGVADPPWSARESAPAAAQTPDVSTNCQNTGWEVVGSRRRGMKKEETLLVKRSYRGLTGDKKAGRQLKDTTPVELEKAYRSGISSSDGFQGNREQPNVPGIPPAFERSSQRVHASRTIWANPPMISNPADNFPISRDHQPVRSSSNAYARLRENSSRNLENLPSSESGLPDSLNSGVPGKNYGDSISLDPLEASTPALISANGFPVFDHNYPSSDNEWSEDGSCHGESTMSFESLDSDSSHSTNKRNKWFHKFFKDLDVLPNDEADQHDRGWHCPACRDAVGAINWYRGLQPLLAHARTFISKRANVHKDFAKVLEEEIRIRQVNAATARGSGKYGKWLALACDDNNESGDTKIIWPPMVIIQNTQLELTDEDNCQWIGMGNEELLDLFKNHHPVRARHAYGPQGHRGFGILMFAESPNGYHYALRLDKQFYEHHRGRANWESSGKLLLKPGGGRILYGYMATAEDLEIFNRHSKGKNCDFVKWERRSLEECVLGPMQRQDEIYILQEKLETEMEVTKVVTNTISMLTKKLKMRENEVKVLRDRTRDQYQQHQTEREDMETLFKEKIDQLKQEILDKEKALENIHEEYTI